MEREVYTVPAAQIALESAAQIFTRAFEGYYYPGAMTAADLARRIRVDQIDLWRSPVLVEGERAVGIALVAIRGERAWCGGFGVFAAARGRGLAHTLAAAMVARAREAGARSLALEVLTRNERAIRAYQHAGLATWRDLHVFEWSRPEAAAPPQDAGGEGVAEADPAALLASFAHLHPARPAWQRDLPSLLVSEGLRGLALERGGQLAGYALFRGEDGGRLRVADLAAKDEAAALALLRALQRRAAGIVSVNEPSDSPLTPAFPAAGFREVDRQHDMLMNL